jgi:hypothetical protein
LVEEVHRTSACTSGARSQVLMGRGDRSGASLKRHRQQRTTRGSSPKELHPQRRLWSRLFLPNEPPFEFWFKTETHVRKFTLQKIREASKTNDRCADTPTACTSDSLAKANSLLVRLTKRGEEREMYPRCHTTEPSANSQERRKESSAYGT